MNTTRIRIVRPLVAFCFCLFSVEFGLRVAGLHKLPMYEASDRYEYRFVPNQRCSVFGKDVVINNLGLRGELPDSKNNAIVWYCGDSVINGGIHTHEDSLATTIWDKHAEIQFESGVATVNISQASWGPENTFGFCNHHLTELSSPNLIVLAVSSHDWNDRMTFCYDGHTKDMPSHNNGALANVLNKYFGHANTCVHQAEAYSFPEGTEFDQWLQFSRELNSELMLYLHPTIEEIQAGIYNFNGHKILKWAGRNQVFVCKGLNNLSENGFRDNIHLNEAGQRELANLWMGCFDFPVRIEAPFSTKM